MLWMAFSCGNRYSWIGSVDRYIYIEMILISYNERLKHIESYGGSFFDYFMTTPEYEKEFCNAIEVALEDELLDEEIEGELLELRKVFTGGRVIMG